jgi:type I restriction enzyme S subunit
MIAGLKPYPAYRESGFSGLGTIPAHWQLKRNKFLLREIDERSLDGSEELLTVSQYTGVTPSHARVAENGEPLTRATSLVGYRRVEPGDLVMNIMLAWNGNLGVSCFQGIASPAYSVFRFLPLAAPRFFHYLFRTELFAGIFKTLSTGVVDSRLRLHAEMFFRVSSPLPPLPEQKLIIKYLDHADRQTARCIRARQKLIKLLEEQKRTIIHRAVTRGLDPNVHLKPSGVEWLGELPSHWSVGRLKFVASHIIDCLHATPVYSEGGDFPAIRTADVYPGKLRVESARRLDEEQYRRWTERLVPEERDILYTREGRRFGIAALVPANFRLCISQRMMAFRIRAEHSPAYVMWQLNCGHVYEQAAADLVGAAAPRVNAGRIKNFSLILPPFGEQEAIAAAVEQAIREPNFAILKARREIDLIREFRSRFIADVATGKLDVREAATKLPEEVPEETREDVDPSCVYTESVEMLPGGSNEMKFS